ncbi:hypothetical protein CYMTET_32107 [Cymbomonas tetramitiformis]|uniref:Uncharacterized protein n=1 Tax=Cymbomonas tetramitiformis TaxID=36881 RepID=A0AAE0FG27_9CHLO|nr:hypothetical protein CYMTET_32107 [Cymbomonas tetramitiformis]
MEKVPAHDFTRFEEGDASPTESTAIRSDSITMNPMGPPPDNQQDTSGGGCTPKLLRRCNLWRKQSRTSPEATIPKSEETSPSPPSSFLGSRAVEGSAGDVELQLFGAVEPTDALNRLLAPSECPALRRPGGVRDRRLRGHCDAVLSAAMSPDGARLVTASADRTLRLWDIATASSLACFRAGAWPVTSVRFSSTGAHLVAGCQGGKVWLLDASSGVELACEDAHSKGVTCIEFSAHDGVHLLSGSGDGTLRLWAVLPAGASGGPAPGPPALSAKGTLEAEGSAVLSGCFLPPLAGGGPWRVAGGSEDGTVRLWDVETRALIFRLECPASGKVTAVAASPDGRYLASGSADRAVRLWDVGRRTEVAKLLGHTFHVTSVQFSPDGCRLVSGAMDGSVRVWEVGSGTEIAALEGHAGAAVTEVLFTPDGEGLVSTSHDGTAHVWDAASSMELLQVEAHVDGACAVAFSPEDRGEGGGQGVGAVLASAGAEDNVVRLWDTASGTALRTLSGHSGGVTCVCFSPPPPLGRGRHSLLSGSKDHTLRLWAVEVGQTATVLRGHTDGVTCAGFSADGRRVVSGSRDCTLRLWDISEMDIGEVEAVVVLEGHTDIVTCAEFSPNDGGLRVLSGSRDRTVRLWDAVSGVEMARLEGSGRPVTAAGFSRDGRRLVSASLDAEVRLWDAESGVAIAVLSGPGHAAEGAAVITQARDVRLAARGRGQEGHLVLKEDKGECGVVLAPGPPLHSVRFSPDGQRVLAGGGIRGRGVLRLWDVETGAAVATLEGHEGVVHGVCFSPDGRQVASAAEDGTVRLWDVGGRAEAALLEGHSGGITAVCFSTDGRWIASGGEDRTVRLWEAGSGAQLATLEGHKGLVSAVAFSADGTRLLSGSADAMLKVWNVERGSEVSFVR